MKSLIIVESPAKAKTLERFLGRTYRVRATKGHVRDLPRSQFGVDVDKGFVPKYITIRGKGEVLRDLKEAVKKADRVFLATDPDREGEAISWHLAETLGIPKAEPTRIVFHEITRDAVKRALRRPRPIDDRLVDAQQARRVLDRLVGYKLSPLLWRKIHRGLSAGRVQSVALRLIVDRERERRGFVPEEYWTVEATFRTPGGERVEARLVTPEGKRPTLPGEAAVDAALASLDRRAPFVTGSVERRERQRLAAPPFTTSTLQQEASRRLGFSVRKTMTLAQILYEGVDLPLRGRTGLITYMRTDATRIAQEAQAQAAAYIKARFGETHAHPVTRKETKRIGEQGAHEGIRPTSMDLPPEAVGEGLTPDQMKLYRLIWERFLASQMTPARLEVTTVLIRQGDLTFRASGQVVVFPGFLAAVGDPGEEDDKEGDAMPPVREGEPLRMEDVRRDQHFTEPPPRFSEAMLVKTLEEAGIGRPSTYVPIIQTIQERDYVRKEDRRFIPSELGELVVDLLREHFPKVVDPAFTAELENELDEIEEGNTPWQEVLQGFYEPFASDLERAEATIGKLPIKDEESDVICDRCGRRMVVKNGRFGRFLACPGFPECKNTKPLLETTGVTCPECGQGEVVTRRSKKGRTFYGCSRYPECRFTSWQKPTGRRCPECEAGFLVERRQRGGPVRIACNRPECTYVEEAEAVPSEV